MSKNIVPVFMAVDDGYIPFLGVALKSVIENSSKENKYEIKILYTKVSEENKNKIKETLKYNKSWESKIGNQTKIRRKKDESSIGTLSWTGK